MNKKQITCLLSKITLASSILVLTACNDEPVKTEAAEVQLNSMEAKVSYIIGYSLAEQLGDANMELSEEAVVQAMADVKSGADYLLTPEQMQEAGTTFQNMQREIGLAKAAKENIDLGKAWLIENAKREGVVTTASGLQYEVMREGKGEQATAEDIVTVHYHGTLLDGTVFDSSIESDEPVDFPVTEVIPGWTEALQLMHVGDKWKVAIPHTLAYPNGTRTIPSGSTLLFEIELLHIQSK